MNQRRPKTGLSAISIHFQGRMQLKNGQGQSVIALCLTWIDTEETEMTVPSRFLPVHVA
jgi:hypothetical protein